MLWGISPNAPAKEKIKSEFEGIIRGLDCVGEIDYLTYSKLFDEIMPLFDKMHEQGKMDAVNWHKYPEVPLPETEFAQEYLVTAVGKYAKPHVRTAFGHKNFDAYKGEFTVIAWAELPDPYKPE